MMLATAQNLVERPRLALATIAVASVAILGAALAFQYVGGLRPCQLCLYQRIPYLVTTPLAVLAVLAFRWLGPSALAMATGLCGLAFAAGAVVAVFHVGVEQQWWPGLASCSGTIDPSLSFEQLKAQLLAAPVIRCDEVQWSLLGISMAGYNAVLSVLLAIFAGAATILCFARRRGLGARAQRHA